MRFLLFGDVVGRAGRDVVIRRVAELRQRLSVDFVVVNGENAAGGFGITRRICEELFDAGADVITTGNHVWDQRETLTFIDSEPRLLRPANFPAGTPGRGVGVYDAHDGRRVMVLQVMGRVFMDALDDPFARVEEELAPIALVRDVDAIVVDIHGEATSEKMAMGCLVDGRVSVVVGTHSHVPTADARVLPGGTAYQTDLGMCGDYDSVIGMEKEEPLNRFVRKIPGGRFSPAQGAATLCGLFVETDDATGLARRAAPVRLEGHLESALPEIHSSLTA
jgi:metallophosphoesterase (TIGR00282 family)